MFPHVHGQNWLQTVGCRGICIRSLHHLQFAVLNDEPSPATAELGGARVFEVLSELVVASKIGLDLVCNGAGRRAPAVRFYGVPIKRMVPDLSCIVEDTGLGAVPYGLVNDVLQRLIRQLCPLDQFIYVDNIGVVVFAVVKI
jgi:hypothetical protein